MNDQVFISYSDDDRSSAESTRNTLERAGLQCWMAHRDLLPGISWSQTIIDEIHASRVMVLILSKHSNASQYVIREVVAAVERHLPIITVRIEDLEPSKRLKFFIGAEQWLDAFALPREEYEERLVEAVQLLIEQAPEPAPSVPDPIAESEPERRAPSVIAQVAGARSLQVRTLVYQHRKALLASSAVIMVASLGGFGVHSLRARQQLLQKEPTQQTDSATQTDPASLVIAPASTDRTVGDTFRLQPILKGEQAHLRWASSDPAVVGIVDSAGLFRAAGAGSAVLRAETDRSRDSIRVSVRRPAVASLKIVPAAPASIYVGESRTLRVIARDSAGRDAPWAEPVWRSETPRIVSVAPDGTVRGLATGRGRIKAHAESATTTVEIVVKAEVVAAPSPSLTNQGTTPPGSPIVPPRTTSVVPTESALRELAGECITALQKADKTWLETHYQPGNAEDVANRKALLQLVDRPAYKVTQQRIDAPKDRETAIDFRVDFSYRRFTGGGGAEHGMFRVEAARDGGSWQVASCRIVGALVRS